MYTWFLAPADFSGAVSLMHISIHLSYGPSLYHVSKGTGWMGSKQLSPTFSTSYADVGLVSVWVCGSEIVQKYADVIKGWSLREGASFMSKIQSDSYRRRHGQTDRYTELCSLGSPQVHLLSPSSGIEP